MASILQTYGVQGGDDESPVGAKARPGRPTAASRETPLNAAILKSLMRTSVFGVSSSGKNLYQRSGFCEPFLPGSVLYRDLQNTQHDGPHTFCWGG